MFKTQRITAVLAVLFVAATVSISGATAASAEPSHPNILLWHHKKVINESHYTTTNYANKLAYCYAGSAGVSCSISKTVGATVTIGTSLGMSRGAVAGQLSITSARTTSVTVGCQSPPLKANQQFAAYPRGKRSNYKIQVTQNYAPTSETSGALTSFAPDGGITCRVE